MHSIDELKNGGLKGIKHLKIQENLDEFPMEILTLKDSLEILDMSGNRFSVLPEEFAQLVNLKIVFFSNNLFTVFPEVLGRFPLLEMIGFKSNRIALIPSASFPRLLRWLILTDNCLKELPATIGSCTALAKCMLAGNSISELPDAMSGCHNLELLRLSANEFVHFPDWLFTLPKLSWLAIAGNPAVKSLSSSLAINDISWQDLKLGQQIGEGASGFISKAVWNYGGTNEEVAVKVFKGSVTSDGLPQDEMAATVASGTHPQLIEVLSQIPNHPDGKKALVFELIRQEFKNLGLPPTFATCTRDVYLDSVQMTAGHALKIAHSIASVCAHLHGKKIMHGDLYAHNILTNTLADTLLTDFGAGVCYDCLDNGTAQSLQRLEVRAFGCLLEDLLQIINAEEHSTPAVKRLMAVRELCMQTDVAKRPAFIEIVEMLL